MRDYVSGPPAHIGALGGGWHPAVASSRALEELAGWVEQVVLARKGHLSGSFRINPWRYLVSKMVPWVGGPPAIAAGGSTLLMSRQNRFSTGC